MNQFDCKLFTVYGSVDMPYLCEAAIYLSDAKTSSYKCL